MLLVLSSDGPALARQLAQASQEDDAVCVITWDDFESKLARSRCAVIGCPSLNPGIVGRLATLRVRAPHVPVILATERDAQALVLLKDLILDLVIFLDALDGSLRDALEELTLGPFLLSCALSAERATDLPSRVRMAMTAAFRAAPLDGGAFRSADMDPRALLEDEA